MSQYSWLSYFARPERVLVVLALLVSGCVADRRPPETPVKEQEAPAQAGQIVRASFYGRNDGFDGRVTASGEVFDAEKLTAAHRSYPFGTILEVTNPKNGRTVQVRVNDRGPFVRGRSIDLSAAAAERLGLINEGVAEVKLRKVSEAMSEESQR